MEPFDVDRGLRELSEPFEPVDLAYVDGYVLRGALVRGDFHWHRHVDQDELFLCHSGRLRVESRDESVDLLPGEGVVVPKGVEHRTSSVEGALVLVMEGRETRSRGD
ncbi:MAG: cupin domain-containing protein [Gemmatimonadales bacterium]|nr:cupin domain-containing protein [Gemmatimonadales bacterium]